MALLAKSLEDVNVSLRNIQNFIDNFNTKDIDLRGRKITNAGSSRDETDYVIRRELFIAIQKLTNDTQADINSCKNRLDDIERRLAKGGL